MEKFTENSQETDDDNSEEGPSVDSKNENADENQTTDLIEKPGNQCSQEENNSAQVNLTRGHCEETVPPVNHSDRFKTLEMILHRGVMEAQKENSAVGTATPKLMKQKSGRDHQKKSHRKSSLPNHVIDRRRIDKVAQWCSDSKDKDLSREVSRSSEEEGNKNCSQGEEGGNLEDDDLLKFAEILYKCSLCTTLPCILTSRPAFLKHVRDYHLATRGPGIQCHNCHLHFHTHTDLLVHLSDSAQCDSQGEAVSDSQCKSSSEDYTDSPSTTENTSFSLEKHERGCKTEEQKRQVERENVSYHHPLTNPGAQSHSSAENLDFLPPNENQTQNFFSHHDHGQSERFDNTTPPFLDQPTSKGEWSNEQEDHNQLEDRDGRCFRVRNNQSPSLKKDRMQSDDEEHENKHCLHDSDNRRPPLGKDDRHDSEDDPELRTKSRLDPEGRDLVQSSSAPMATVEYHSSQHLNHLQLLTDQAMSSPPPSLLSHQQPDYSRRPLFNTSLPDGVNGFPSFTPEFGRFTKLIREGGKIVYFCQVCNVKCQVKAAFQVHCNGVRHHNHVNMASKNKLKVASGDPVTSRGDAGFRTPLREVGPQVTSPRPELSFMEKMSKFFQGHGDVSTLFGRGRGLGLGSSAGPTAAAELGFRSPASVDSESRDSKDSRADSLTPDKGGSFSDKKHQVQFSSTPASSPQPNFQVNKPAHGSTESRKERREDSSHGLKDGKGQTPDAEHTRDRHSRDPSSREGQTIRLSSELSVDDGESVPVKRPRLVETPDKTGRVYLDENHDSVSHGKLTETVSTDTQAQTHRENTRTSDSESRENVSTEHAATVTENQQSDSQKLHLPAEQHPSPLPPSGFSQGQGHPVPMATMGKFPFPADPASCFYPRMLSESWFHDACAVKTEPISWDGMGGATPDNEDVAMEMSKGPNNEGWKVTKIRDVLRDVLAASSKGSSVSRDSLLQHVSVVLRDVNVLHWGPACNRAVRELFPHCLAQRKGKFKKTYFFGLCLLPGLEEPRGEDPVDGLSFRPLRDMTQDLEQLLEHLPGLLFWSGEVSRGVSRDEVLHVLAARLSESEVYQWGMQCNKALRILFPLVLMKRKGKYKTTVYFGVDFTPTAKRLVPALDAARGAVPWHEQPTMTC